ncbi:MAG: FeoA family protein [Kiritimatiellia bacterium]
MKIFELQKGQRARVTGFAEGDRVYRQKLIQMGLRRGVVLVVLRKAPLGDPVEVNCGGVLLTLRKGESDIVEVEAL